MSESDFSRPAGPPVGMSGNPPSYTPRAAGAEPPGSSSIPAATSEVATHAGEAGKDLAHAAEDRAGDLAREAAERARALMDQARYEVTEQASSQQQRLAGSLRSIGAELGRMGDASDDPGYATDLVRQGSVTASRFARWLEDREPGDVLREVGLVAFGLGLVVASLIPASEKETEVAQRVKEAAEPLMDDVKEMAGTVASDLREPAQEELRAMGESVKEAGSDLAEQGRAAASDVAEHGKEAASDIRGREPQG